MTNQTSNVPGSCGRCRVVVCLGARLDGGQGIVVRFTRHKSYEEKGGDGMSGKNAW